MAQAIHCDGEGHRDAMADVLVSRIENGDTSAWCMDHYVELCRAVVETFEAAEREATEAEALARLETAGAAAQAKAGPGPELYDPSEGSPDPVPDPGVQTFRQEGDESVQEGVGGTETGASPEAAPESAPDVDGAPGPSSDVQETVTDSA